MFMKENVKKIPALHGQFLSPDVEQVEFYIKYISLGVGVGGLAELFPSAFRLGKYFVRLV